MMRFSTRTLLAALAIVAVACAVGLIMRDRLVTRIQFDVQNNDVLEIYLRGKYVGRTNETLIAGQHFEGHDLALLQNDLGSWDLIVPGADEAPLEFRHAGSPVRVVCTSRMYSSESDLSVMSIQVVDDGNNRR